MASERALLEAALSQYELGPQLGRGAFGVVFEATHRSLGRKVAIKQLPTASAADAAVRDRFLAEARLVASFTHPHIVPVHDFVIHEGILVLVMELLPGGTLWQRFERTGLRTDEACGVVLAACSALGYAHERGVLHRDIKPDNVMFAADGTAKLTDFGLAKLVDSEVDLTKDGLVVGTPAYMAPEQALGEPLSPATDVYSSAVMLYELLAGRLPFASGDPNAEISSVAMLLKHVNERPRPLGLAAPHVPSGVAAVVERALDRNPQDRYQSAEQFGVALAVAATEAFGTGWLNRAGTPVTGSVGIAAAAERSAVGGGSTVLVRPPVREHVPAAAEGFEPSGADPGGATEVRSPPPAPGSARRRGRRPIVAALVVAVVLAVAGGAFAILHHDGDKDSTALSESNPTTEAQGAPGFAPNEIPYRDACVNRPVLTLNAADRAQRCRCVIDQIVTVVGTARFFTEAFLKEFSTPGPRSPIETDAVARCAAQGK